MILDLVIDIIREEFAKNPPIIHNSTLNSNDIQYMKQELTSASNIDIIGLRRQAWNIYKDNTDSYISRETTYAKIICIPFLGISELDDIPWELWMRIIRSFEGGIDSRRLSDKKVRIIFCTHPSLRVFPTRGVNICPADINGGYTYPCNRSDNTIIIYRAEDATRVLIHELLHLYCTDNHKLGIDRVEAETEAWSELLYCGFLGGGNRITLNKLIADQCIWMINQNEHLYCGGYVKRGTIQFPWRYTIGKQDVWRRWGLIDTGSIQLVHCINSSLRLTKPPSMQLKRQFGVSRTSTIL